MEIDPCELCLYKSECPEPRKPKTKFQREFRCTYHWVAMVCGLKCCGTCRMWTGKGCTAGNSPGSEISFCDKWEKQEGGVVK